MNEQLERLVRLQELDHAAARLRQRIAEIGPQIEASRAALRSAEQRLEEGRARVEAGKKDRRQAEKDLDVQIDKLRKFEEQSSKVKTNKEYQALMGELEGLRAEKTAIEDRILAFMEGQGELEATVPPLAAEVKREQEAFAAEEGKLRTVEAGLRGELEHVEAQRASAAGGLEAGALAAYQRVQRLRGDAVAEVREQLCLGCRTMLPPQNYVEVMRNDAVRTCPHCNRILFHKKLDAVPAAAAPAPAAEA